MDASRASHSQVSYRRHRWWRRFLPAALRRHPLSAYRKPASNDFTGFGYIDFLALIHATLRPRTYLEIGTAAGASLAVADCRSVCIDPHFQVLAQDGAQERVFFSMTSDAFFVQPDVAAVFPDGVDLAFLDGMHHYEFLYRDLMNTERFCHTRSIVVLHDCLPLSARMAERKFRRGDAHEKLPGAWTGDVWKLMPALKKYRPDLDIAYLDCDPTGLVLISGLCPSSRTLQKNYRRAVAEFIDLDFDRHSNALYTAFPMLDSGKIAVEPTALLKLLRG